MNWKRTRAVAVVLTLGIGLSVQGAAFAEASPGPAGAAAKPLEPPPSTPAPAAAPAPASGPASPDSTKATAPPAPQLAALVTYGKAGIVRFVVSAGELAGKAQDRIVVRIQNEGEEPVVLRAGDSCTASLADGTKVPLKRLPVPGEKTIPVEIVVEPLHAEEIALSPPAAAKGRIVSIDIASEELGRTVSVKDAYEPPSPRLTVPPSAPPGRAAGPVSSSGPVASDPLGWEEVTAALVVAADGKVTSVTVLPDEDGKTARAPLADAVVTSARTWSFEPARRSGAAERSLVVRTFRFGARKVVRRVFNTPAKDFEPRLARYLHEGYPWVVDIASADGYAVAARPWKKKGIRGADAWLLRIGEASPAQTWVAVTSMTLLVRESPHGASCECYWRAAQENGSIDFMDLLAAKLDLTAVEAKVLAPQDGALIPSGTLEPDELGRWSRAAVGKLFDASFSTILGKNKKKVAFSGVLSRLEPNQPPPTAAEFLPAPAGALGARASADPLHVEGDVVPPVLVRRVNPDYPPEAKYERVQGRVFLELTIDTAGNVTDLEIQRGIPGLNVSSVDAACCWKFKHATKNGQPVSVYYLVYLDYGMR
jgi:TonB family protein